MATKRHALLLAGILALGGLTLSDVSYGRGIFHFPNPFEWCFDDDDDWDDWYGPYDGYGWPYGPDYPGWGTPWYPGFQPRSTVIILTPEEENQAVSPDPE